MRRADYYTEKQVEDAMAVVATWMSNDSNLQVVYHNGTAVDADIFKGIIRIPRLACASGLTHEALMLLRSRSYHEAGHIDDTKLSKKDYPEGVLFEIWNALEDRRMESSKSRQHKGCNMVFRWSNDHHNKRIAGRLNAGHPVKPLWEALVALGLISDGVQPAWNLSEKAQLYADTAHDEFMKIHKAKNAYGSLDIAKKIYDILKEAYKEHKKDNPEEQQPKQDSNEQQRQESGDEDGEPQSQGGMDFEDEENEMEEGQQGESSKGDDSEDDKDESDEDSKDSEGEVDDSDDDGDSDSGKSDAGKDDFENEASDSKSGDQDESDSKQDTKDYEPENGEQDDTDIADQSDEDIEEAMRDECDGISKEEIENEELEEYFKNLDPSDAQYLSRRDFDKHIIPETGDRDRQTYKERHEMVAVMVPAMTRSLEQALRSLARCHKKPYMRQGKIDKHRFVQIAKNLSKEVFYKTRDGMTLDVAVEIIIDESASMNKWFEVQLLALAIGEALSAIRVPFEITGTTTAGNFDPPLDGFSRTKPIIYRHYKSFNEQWNSVRHRIINTYNHNNNIDGEAVEYCAFRLADRKERRKIIFSLSDGRPCGGQDNDGVLAANIKRVCQRVRESGIEVYGFGVGTMEPRMYYGAEYFVYLEDPSEMGPQFVRKFADIVTGGIVRV